MSAQIKFQNHAPKELNGTRNKVEVTVLLSRLNTERKIEEITY